MDDKIHEPKYKTLKDLSTVNELINDKKIPENIRQLYVKRQDGSLINTMTVDDTRIQYGNQKVFNYYDRKNGTMDLFIVGE